MSNIEKIKAEIERQLEYFKGKEDDAWDDCDNYTDEDAQWYQGHWKMCSKLLSFIDSLPEEKPSENLEEEVKRYYSDNFTYISSDQPTLSILTNVARHFAEWQKEQMMKDAVEGEIVQDMKGLYHVKSVAFVSDNSYNFGDKVRIIIVKED